MTSPQFTQQSTVTNHQPLSNISQEVADAYFDFDIPSSPTDESEYARLVDTSVTSPQETIASESGCVCSSPISAADNNGVTENSDNSSDEPYFDPDNSDLEQRSLSLSVDYYDCDEANKREASVPLSDCDESQSTLGNNVRVFNGIDTSTSESLPCSQSNSTSLSNCTAITSESINTLTNDFDTIDFCTKPQANEIDAQTIIETLIDLGKEDEIQDSLTGNLSGIDIRNIEVKEIPKFETIGRTNSNDDTLLNADDGEVVEQDEDEPLTRPERVRRCSSLKTGKTPPGTPGRKKIVRFADVLGLDLADIRTFMDDIPKIPSSAYEDLQTTFQNDPPISLGQRLEKVIVPMFQQPGSLPSFLDIVQSQNVALENAAVTDPICLTITGVVRVRNLDFNKSVLVRYTLDGWRSFSDLQAQYVENSCDGFSDKFSFILFGNSLEVGKRIEIAVRFLCKGQQYWDSNHGQNYIFQCLPGTSVPLDVTFNKGLSPDTRPDLHLRDSWCGSSFY